MRLKAIIVDDEPVARKVIREYMEDIEYLELAGMAENPLKAGMLLSEQAVDLIFLDINMPKLSGIEFLRASGRREGQPLTIITTAYAEYALDGFELDVVDYLLKPISFERFLKACNKARDYYMLARRGVERGAAGSGVESATGGSAASVALAASLGSGASVGSAASAAKGLEADHFFVKCDSRLEKVLYDELVYVEAMANYIILHTAARKLIVYLTMKGILEKLPADRFLQVHKSFIINLDRIRSIQGNTIDLGIGEVTISQHYYDVTMKEILKDKVIKR